MKPASILSTHLRSRFTVADGCWLWAGLTYPDVVRPFFADESARHLDDMATTREPVRRGIDLIDTNEL